MVDTCPCNVSDPQVWFQQVRRGKHPLQLTVPRLFQVVRQIFSSVSGTAAEFRKSRCTVVERLHDLTNCHNSRAIFLSKTAMLWLSRRLYGPISENRFAEVVEAENHRPKNPRINALPF